MNIHVFYVNKGDMLTYDLSHAMGSVSKLQRVIEQDLLIPQERQVMLVSGGETMSPSERVSNYSAGTDTCPIFLFNLKAIEEKSPPEVLQRLDGDSVKQRVEGSINMAPTLATLSTRTQLALELRDLSQQRETECRNLVHEQHLQHQGWCAVVANLEDSLQVFTEQADVFISWYQQFLEHKSEQQELLQNFPESYEILSKMPILPSLREVLSKPKKEDIHDGTQAKTPDTILAFFISLEDNPSLVEEAEKLVMELSKLDQVLLEQMVEEKEKVLEAAAMPSMKEVRGLENRLSSLEQLILKTASLVKEQEEYAQGFVNNQRRCRQLADPNVLPDLSISHKLTLRSMEKNYMKLMNHLEQCMGTKQELCANLHARLRWTMYVQKIMSSLDGRIALQFENLERLKLRLGKLEQVARAPAVYAKLCAEVCRRKSFSLTYNKWNHDVYNKATDMYRKELEHRKKFLQFVGKHCLKAFFPGLAKVPPQVMVLPPVSTEDDLPCITEQEIASLKQNLPELEPWLMVHDEHHGSEIVSLISTLSPDTPSDIVMLSTRHSHSSHGSIAKALSPEFEHQILSTHTAPSTMESISGNSNSAADVVVRADDTEHDHGQLEPVIHRMARFDQFDHDEDIDHVTEDEPAPNSPHDIYTTAKFTLSFDDDCKRLAVGSKAIAEQSVEVEQLQSENSLLKEKCRTLQTLIQLAGLSAFEGVRELREAHNLIIGDLSTCSASFRSLQAKMLSAVDAASSLCQPELDARMQVQSSEPEDDLTRELPEHQAQGDHTALKGAFKSLQTEYDSLLMEMDAREAQQKAELEVAVKETGNVAIQTENSEDQQKQNEILSLRGRIEDLTKEMEDHESAAKRNLEEVKASMSKANERKLAQLHSEHKGELVAMKKERRRWEIELLRALELEGLIESTDSKEDLSSDAEQAFVSDDAGAAQQLQVLCAEIKRVREKAIAEATTRVERDYQQQLADQRSSFVEQEEEFHYRSEKMKETLQLTHEIKYEEGLTKLRKEKDGEIRQMRAKLARSTTMADSVVCVETASTSTDLDLTTDIEALQEQLSAKEVHIKRLQDKLNSFEMSASLRAASLEDKVSVKSCAAGDKVILCYDDQYRHYLIFSLEPINYFVHTDSLDGLGIDDSLPSDQRKSWLLAEVVSKVLCQAKKENNRFRVPVDTKFYRVKVKPWKI